MSSKHLERRVGKRAHLEALEMRRLLAAGFRSFDGSGNNLESPDWGSVNTTLLRLADAEYADGVSEPAGGDRPSARAISNALAAHPEGEEIHISTHLAAFTYVWGQFIDHDLDLTTPVEPAEPFNVAVPTGDPQFDPHGTGTQEIFLRRSKYEAGSNPRQQINEVTAFLDGSMVYGSDEARATALRTGEGGRLKTSDGNLLPFNTDGLPNANDAHIFPDEQLFVAGDVRSNENIELTSLHTLFVREHNRWADLISQNRPGWSDERVYQQARRYVVAEIQRITYSEFLPALLGPNALPRYRGYDADVDPGIATEFSTAGFRLGHSMLADDVEFFDNEGEEVREEMPLAEAFFNPTAINEDGIDPILKYLGSSNAEEIDNMIVDGVRNFLFGPPGAGGFDLASLNVQRGRDHALADYNDTREAIGLGRVASFTDITPNTAVQDALAETYGDVDNIDLWVGGLAEDHVRGSNIGETFQAIVVDQFTRLRDGDRFWYQRDLSGIEQRLIRNTTLGDIVSRNTGISNLQENVFVFDVEIDGRVWNDRNGDGRQNRRERGLAGQTVELVDEEGEVVDTAVTNRRGDFEFEGVQLGDFIVRPVTLEGWEYTTDETLDVDVTRGDHFGDVNFGLRRSAGTAPTAGILAFSDGGRAGASGNDNAAGDGLRSDFDEWLA